MVTRFRRRKAERASLNYDRLTSDRSLERWQTLEQRLHGFDIAIIFGLVITVLGVPAVFLMLWFFRS